MPGARITNTTESGGRSDSLSPFLWKKEKPLKSLALVALSILWAVFKNMTGRVKYLLGAKAPSLACDSHEIHLIDCSGAVRYFLYRATRGELILPEGSQAQLEWCIANGLHRLAHYSDVAFAKDDPTRLFICFLKPHAGEEWPRHVWLVVGGRTLESCGSHGVCSRDWDDVNLVHCVDAFELPATL